MCSDWPGPAARSQETSPTSLPRVALPSVSRAQPPYPNGKAASPGCVSVSTGHVGHTGWHGAGPRPQKKSLAGGACCQPTVQLARPGFRRDGAPGLRAGARAESGLRRGVRRGAASESGRSRRPGWGPVCFGQASWRHEPRGLGRSGAENFAAPAGQLE